MSKEKEVKARAGKEAADRAALEATAAMKATELEMKKSVVRRALDTTHTLLLPTSISKL